jgi:hypothetical protein
MKSDRESPALAARSTNRASSASDRRRTTLFGRVFSGALRGSFLWSMGSMPSFLGRFSLASRVCCIALDTWDCETNGKQDHRPASQTGIQSREYPARNLERLSHHRSSAPRERINRQTVANADYPRGRRENTQREGNTHSAARQRGELTIGRGGQTEGKSIGHRMTEG